MAPPAEPARNRDHGDGENVREMFSGIAGRYDLLNTVLSLGIDRSWRGEAAELALDGEPASVLDAATGTGEVAFAIKSRRPETRVVGVDFSHEMLEIAARKAGERRLDLELVESDVLSLPFQSGTFGAVTIAYGLRNLADLEVGLRELHRVLEPGGRLVILEFPPPPEDAAGQLFRFYFTNILPLVGGWISGNRGAYEYLPDSVLAFPRPPELAALVGRAGFTAVRYRLQTYGVSVILTGVKKP